MLCHALNKTNGLTFLRTVHVGFSLKLTHWRSVFFFVFSHDKQETEEVVQLQEGGEPRFS